MTVALLDSAYQSTPPVLYGPRGAERQHFSVNQNPGGIMLSFHAVKSGAVMLSIGMAALCCLSLIAWAQSTTGGLRGVVTDSGNAALPGAIVLARNAATGIEIKTTTNN